MIKAISTNTTKKNTILTSPSLLQNQQQRKIITPIKIITNNKSITHTIKDNKISPTTKIITTKNKIITNNNITTPSPISNSTTNTNTNSTTNNNTTSTTTSITLNGKSLYIIINKSKQFSRFFLFNENMEMVQSKDTFLSSSKLCYTNDINIKFDQTPFKKSSNFFTRMIYHVTNEITIEYKKRKSLLQQTTTTTTTNAIAVNDTTKFYIRDIEIYFPNYLYPVRNYNLLKSKQNGSSSSSSSYKNNYITSCIENKVIPNKIIFKTYLLISK
jgi:hypothetical protein